MEALTETGAPVILTGMHRSGTTLVAQLLRRCGLFIGVARDHNEEARFFLQQNQRILQLAHAAWDAPENTAYLWQAPAVWQAAAEAMGRTIARDAARAFGGRRWPWQPAPWQHAAAWGWKDPRTGLLLPLWGQLFPRRAWSTWSGTGSMSP